MDARRTEQPTPKRKLDARKQGNRPVSVELTGALMTAMTVTVVWAGAEWFVGIWRCLLEVLWYPAVFTSGAVGIEWLSMGRSVLLRVMICLGVPVFLVGILSGGMQAGCMFSSIRCDVRRVDPAAGFRRLFSMRKGVDLVRITLKAGIVTVWIGRGLFQDSGCVLSLTGQDALRVVPALSVCATGCAFRCVGLFVVFGLIDACIQRRRWIKDLMMTRDEVRRELKDSDGDPDLKARRQELHRIDVNGSLPERVSRSALVIVNPTHYAVALQYDRDKTGAPRIAAKGAFSGAKKIRTLARAHRVPILRHPPLARQLIHLSVDQEIPETLFKAVAELLVFVLRLTENERKMYR
ncbi:EscU/YscU/HrcU family type III secretion system export apparatus switch protein [bacterium]|nr:EscU/YscU/HrcU family type III secretion system export apparatus switch protein [candidate division CSSED10-310 bacterium]